MIVIRCVCKVILYQGKKNPKYSRIVCPKCGKGIKIEIQPEKPVEAAKQA
jgi:uncharacterized Zn finger protein (UPF0148 family)